MTPLSHLHSVAPAAEPIDLARAQRAARELLTALGCDLTEESVREMLGYWVYRLRGHIDPRKVAQARAGGA